MESGNTSARSANSFSGLCTSSHQISTPLPLPLQLVSDSLTSDSFSNSDAVSIATESPLKEDFINLGKSVLADLRTVIHGLNTERERLKAALDADPCILFNSNNQNVINVKDDVNQILKQNLELKNRLLKIHEASNLTEMSSLEADKRQTYNCSLSYSSSCVSATEFFDAEDLTIDKTAVFRGDDEKDEESEVRTRSETSSEADSFSSGEGSVSSESDLGGELQCTSTNLEAGGKLTVFGSIEK